MGRYAKDSGGGDFEQVPTGTHIARCYQIIDIGTHQGDYQGKPVVRNQVIVRWELPNEVMETGDPFIASRFYTNSLGEKANLRADLEAWRGRSFSEEELNGFDLMNILGKPCQLSIIDKNGKSRVSGVMAMPKGMQCPPQINPSVAFWIDEWDQAVFDSLPEGFKKLIMESDEYKARDSAPALKKSGSFADLAEDITF